MNGHTTKQRMITKNQMFRSVVLLAVMALTFSACNTNDTGTSTNTLLTDVAQTSGQLASGSSFVISGSSSSSSMAQVPGMNMPAGPGMHGPGKGGHHGGPGGFLDGTNLLAPTDELLAIVEAESAGDMRGMRMHERGGATVTNYDANGNVILFPLAEPQEGGPEGCSFSGKQFPRFDSLLAKIAKTVIDFGDGVTNTRKDITVTRSGKIIITRSGDGTSHTEVVTFENFKVNGALIEGTKTRVSSFTEATGTGTSSTSVAGGKITFNDGTAATWTSNRSRTSNVVLGDNGRPVSGEVTITGKTSVDTADGTVIYSHEVTKPIREDLSCGHRRPPVEGTVVTHYRENTVSIDFGSGSCNSSTITISLNGVVQTKTFGD